MKHRHEKRTEYIRELISEFIQRESNGSSIITVTRFEMSDKQDVGDFYISVLPETQENAAMDFIKRNLSELRGYVMEKIPAGHIPFFTAHIDQGEKLRRKIDTLN